MAYKTAEKWCRKNEKAAMSIPEPDFIFCGGFFRRAFREIFAVYHRFLYHFSYLRFILQNILTEVFL